MKRFTVNMSIAVVFGLGIVLALLCALEGGNAPAVAAPAPLAPSIAEGSTNGTSVVEGPVLSSVEGPRTEGNIEVPNASTAELHVCPSGCAYSSVQDAVDAANDGDVIKVAAGIYTGVDNLGGLAQVVYVNKTVTIRGGYTTANDFADPPNPEANPTTVDAQGGGRVLYITGSITPTVEGLRITGGNADGLGGGPWGGPDSGGGVYVISATATIRDNQVFGNSANWGGGVFLFSNTTILSSNIIFSNTAYGEGGGVGLYQGNATLNTNIVRSNTATGGGGGLYLYLGVAMLNANTITFNIADTLGGGLYLDSSNVTLTNNIVTDNQTNNEGSGLFISGSSSRLLHTTIVRNTGGFGQGICVSHDALDHSTVAMTNTILVSHTTGIYVEGGDAVTLEGTLWNGNGTNWSGPGTINRSNNHFGAPIFVDPDAGNYHITLDSAALNAGVDAGVTEDVDGDSRSDGYPDIGADELSYPPCHARINDAATEYTTVQAAVDAASPGDVVKVAGYCVGVQGRLASPGHAGPSIIAQVVYISKTVTIRGGYTTTNWSVSNPISYPTTLDAWGQGRVFYITGASAPGAGISPTIEGLRITGGDSAGPGEGDWEQDAGGGIYVITATVTISGCQVVSNTANRFIPYGGDGGGIYLWNSPNAVLSGNIIQGNAAWYGGGIYLRSSSNVTLISNTIQDNQAAGWYGASGGGVLLEDSPNAMLTGNTIQSNTAQVGGGIFLIGSDNATLSGNTIRSNADGGSHTFFEGGGVCMWDSDNTTLSGNTIQGNSGEEGGGVCLWDSNNATLSDNVIRGNLGGLGSGVCMWDSDNVTLSGNSIQDNATYWWYSTSGSGVWLSDCDTATLNNNVIADNQGGTAGGGIYVAGSTAHLRHTTLARNGDGSGLYVGGAYSTVALTNTVLVSHTVGISVAAGNTVTLNGILWYRNDANTDGPGPLIVTHQITGNPAFAADGYHITPASAALDAGVDAGVSVDIDGEPRPAGTGYDIGADEFPAALSVTKQASPDPVQPGEQLTYTISVANTGNVNLHATITDTLPVSVTLGGTSGGTLVPPGGTVILPNGRAAVVWTAVITAPGGLWTGTIVVTVDESQQGPLTNQVEVTTEEGATGQAIAIVNAYQVYLPLIIRNFP